MRILRKWVNADLANTQISLILKLFSTRDKFLLLANILINIFLAMLDLLGVLFIGVIGSLSVTGVGSVETGDRVSLLLKYLGISEYDFKQQVVIIGLIAAFVLIVKTICSLWLSKKVLYFMARRAASLSSDLISKYFLVPNTEINRRTSQASIYALTDGVTTIMVGVVGAIIAIVSDVLLLIVLGIGMYFIDPIASIGTFALFGLLALYLYKSMHNQMRSLGENQGKLSIRSNQMILEAINSYRELVVRNRRSYYAEEISKLRFGLAESNARVSFLSNLSKYVLEISMVVGALFLAYYQISTNTIFGATATIAVFLAASTRITPAILRIQQGFLRIRNSLGGATSTLSLINDVKDLVKVESPILQLSRIHSDFTSQIIVSNLSFSYDVSRRAISDISLHVEPGETVAIIGNSGAGKTTLLDLILGVIEPCEGKVTISGCEPKDSFLRWPGAVGYVPQEITIIDGSLKENLGLGFPSSEITDEYCWEALELASMDRFVRELPLQLNTQVGERGTKLSGGQRQRLGIARALITRPRILILDEATSALDGKTEFEISGTLQKLTDEMSLVVVAHRLSTIKDFKRIYFMDEGQIKGVGTFEELKASQPSFNLQTSIMGL